MYWFLQIHIPQFCTHTLTQFLVYNSSQASTTATPVQTVKEGDTNVRDMVNPDGLTVCDLSSPHSVTVCLPVAKHISLFFSCFVSPETKAPLKLTASSDFMIVTGA